MHGVKYAVISTCTRINVLDNSFVVGPRFCIIVQKCHKFIKERRHAERVKIFSSSIVVDVNCHPGLWFGSVLQTYSDVVGARIGNSFREYTPRKASLALASDSKMCLICSSFMLMQCSRKIRFYCDRFPRRSEIRRIR